LPVIAAEEGVGVGVGLGVGVATGVGLGVGVGDGTPGVGVGVGAEDEFEETEPQPMTRKLITSKTSGENKDFEFNWTSVGEQRMNVNTEDDHQQP